MPKLLTPGVLYVSEEFGTAAHLCACGCGAKIRTPLGPTEWAITEYATGPSLWPSIGNWQQACRSHYIINKGEIEWAASWSDDQVIAGRVEEQYRRQVYFAQLPRNRETLFGRLLKWLKNLFI